jgi:hypothetical protein
MIPWCSFFLSCSIFFHGPINRLLGDLLGWISFCLTHDPLKADEFRRTDVILSDNFVPVSFFARVDMSHTQGLS